MKFKLLTSALLIGATITASAQGYKDGVEYYKANRIDNAKEILMRNINNADTDKAEAFYYLGCIALQEGNKTEAAKYFNDGISANPEFAYNYIGLGQLDLINNLPKAAEKQFKMAEKKAQKDAGVHVDIARAYYNVDPVAYQKQIDKKITKARQVNMEDADIYVFEGDVFADKQEWGSSTGRYEMATTYEPKAAEAYVKGADTYFKINPKYSISLLQNLLVQNPTSALGQRELAEAYYENNMFTKAAEEYGKYINNPNHFRQDEERYLLLLFYGKEYANGYNFASKLVAENENNFTARRFQLIFATNLSEYKDQQLAMAEGILAHKSAENRLAIGDYKMIADILAQNGKAEEALKTIELGVADYPEEESLVETLAEMQAENGQYAKAAKTLEDYINKLAEPKGTNLWELSGYLMEAGRVETDATKKDEYFKRSIEKAELSKDKLADEYHYMVAKRKGDIAILNATNDDDKAIAATADYNLATELLEGADAVMKHARDAVELYKYLGTAYTKQKDYDNAIKNFEKILNFDPTNQGLKNVIEQLRKAK